MPEPVVISAPVGAMLLDNPDVIHVWDFDKAPTELKALSTNGGDEDWLVLVPPAYKDRYMNCQHWINSLGSCGEPDEHTVIIGGEEWTVFIGSHA